MLDLASQELHVGQPAGAFVLLCQSEHLIGHIEAIGLTRRPDPARREQHVDSPARAEVKHGLAWLELGQSGRVAAAQRRLERRVRHFTTLSGIVEVRGNRVATARGARRASTATAVLAALHSKRGLAVFLPNDFLHIACCVHEQSFR